jgi:hypothetical protein
MRPTRATFRSSFGREEFHKSLGELIVDAFVLPNQVHRLTWTNSPVEADLSSAVPLTLISRPSGGAG